METNTGKALQPLTNGGSILIVGVKPSNLDEEIKTHPRVTIWDSQNEHWTNKPVPDNTRVIFMTRFIFHRTSEMLLTEARKRQLTIFNPEGTGLIAKQVRELLAIPSKEPVKLTTKGETRDKLVPLHQFIDFSKGNVENARTLLLKAQEMGITTTKASLAMVVGRLRRQQHQTAVPKSLQNKLDVSVKILDNMIQSLKDMRDFLISTTSENASLRAKMENFKKLMDL